MKKILVIDDNTGILTALRAALTMFGNEVACVSCATEVFKSIETFKPNLIILDLLLSGEDGSDICRSLKENDATKHLPIIMMSAHPSAERIIHDSGADDFLPKPFSLKLLEGLVSKY